jgi:hypothetical protein
MPPTFRRNIGIAAVLLASFGAIGADCAFATSLRATSYAAPRAGVPLSRPGAATHVQTVPQGVAAADVETADRHWQQMLDFIGDRQTTPRVQPERTTYIVVERRSAKGHMPRRSSGPRIYSSLERPLHSFA